MSKSKSKLITILAESLTDEQWALFSALLRVRFPYTRAAKIVILRDIAEYPMQIQKLQQKKKGYGIAIGRIKRRKI